MVHVCDNSDVAYMLHIRNEPRNVPLFGQTSSPVALKKAWCRKTLDISDVKAGAAGCENDSMKVEGSVGADSVGGAPPA